MARNTLQIGQIYCKSDDQAGRRWQVTALFQHPDGLHAQLVRLDDPTRRITLSADALADRRLMKRVADAPGRRPPPASSAPPGRHRNAAAQPRRADFAGSIRATRRLSSRLSLEEARTWKARPYPQRR
jgi:hypothetical protein